ncbi:MAG: nicotinate (nicotinamide) nucleotide adenylyltransferase [Anaerolineales bacterium]|nr:nicotinate (nicotinamide) nucleotide adenylyltransferase [Anaerolineales bacterium]
MAHERIGIFGGTFDPPHFGHLILASEARQQLNLARLLWLLTPQSPLKEVGDILSIEHRLAMVRLAIADNPDFELTLVELELPAPHYTLDTLKVLQGQNPRAHLILLIGGDSLRDLPHWHQPTALVAACHEIGVMRRPDDDLELTAPETIVPGLKEKVRFIEEPLHGFSSSEIRSRIAQGRTVRYFLPQEVIQYIEQHNLYR